MEFNLKDLGATLVTGAYFLVGSFVIVSAISGWNIFFFLRFLRRASSAALTAVALSIAFGAGMLLEDISNKCVDTDTARLPILHYKLLPKDEDLRAETLFDKEFLKLCPSLPEADTDLKKKCLQNKADIPGPGRLSRRAAELGLLAKYGGPINGAAVQRLLQNIDTIRIPTLTRDQLSDVASQLYYHAKNTVYTVPTYYDELKQIQTRIDFSRSFSLLSLFLAGFALVFGGVALRYPDLGSPVFRRFDRRGTRPVITWALSLALMLLFFYWLAGFAYQSEEVEFNKRAYGYFFSMVAKMPVAAANGESASSCGPVGFSGLAPVDQTTFLVVHDTKADCAGPRAGTLTIIPGKGPVYVPLDANWGAPPPNDLEAATAIPGRSGEFLVAESGYYDGQYGRVFHLLVTKNGDKWEMAVRGRLELPKDTENVEGLACLRDTAGKLTILLGERGGTERDPSGRIRWAPVDLANYAPLTVSGESKLNLPAAMRTRKGVRGCADLHIDKSGRVWTVATEDAGDDGPFRSVIYQAGAVVTSGPNPIEMLSQTASAWTIDGFKVEGLSVSPFGPEGALSIATDDEHYDGCWRTLMPAP